MYIYICIHSTFILNNVDFYFFHFKVSFFLTVLTSFGWRRILFWKAANSSNSDTVYKICIILITNQHMHTGADTGVCKRTFSHLYFVDYGKKSQFYDHYQGAPLNNKEKRPHLEFIPVLTPEQCFVIRAGLEVSINAFYTVDKVIIHAFTN